jgi:hypothetical protein
MKTKIKIMKKTIYGLALSVWTGAHYSYENSYLYATKEERDKEMEEYLNHADYLVDTFEQELEL